MKNKKGFTLVELLSTIAILAIVLGIVSAAYVGITKHLKASFYKTLEESILVSGGEYYSYTRDRPEMFADEKKISLKSLVDNKYSTNIVDRKGNQCNLNTSYVGAYKDSYDKTNYYVCLTCDSDEYTSTKPECSGNISYSLQLIATVNDTNKVYQVNNWVNQYVKLTFKTLNDVDKVYVRDTNTGSSFNCTMTGTSVKTCSINVNQSGNYEYYGLSSSNKKTKSGYINILVDKVKPSFEVYENTTLITSDSITKNITSNSININNIVKNIVDSDSKVQSIRYSFEKRGSSKKYVTIDNNLTEFNINKNLGLGKYELIIEIKDYAGNIGSRTITYQINKNITKPDSSYCNDLTYNGFEQTLTKTPGEGYTFTNNKKTDAGSYEVTANVNENYIFSDGSTSAKFTCTIKRQLTATTGSCQSVTYNGGEQVIAKGGSNVTYSNNLKTDAGTYTVTVNANSNYAFSDGSLSQTLNCTLSKKSVAVSWGSTTTFNYNGGAQGPTASASSGVSGETLNITRTTATNAGSYTSTASISSVTGGRANKNNYTLTGNTQLFTINKVTPTITLSATSGSVNAGSTITFTEKASIAGSFSNVSGTTSVATISPASYSSVTANTAKTVTITGVSNGSSTITVTFTPTDTTNYNSKTVTYTVTGYKVASVGTCQSRTYNGSSQTLASGGTGVNYTNNKRTNYGSQTVTVSLKSGYRWSNGTTANKTLSCSISKKAVTITAKDQNLNGTNTITKNTSQITTLGLISGHSVTSITLTQSTTSDTTNGTITPSGAVIKSGTTDVTNNYSITYNKGKLTIVTIKYCANFYLNGASKIDGVASNKTGVCCSPGSNNSCTITSPTITPATNFEVLGWTSNSSNLTIANTAALNADGTKATIKLTKDTNFYAVTISVDSTIKEHTIEFNLNGATSYTLQGITYTDSQRFSCRTAYAYNGGNIPTSCSYTLPTINRSGGNIYGWDSNDKREGSASYSSGATITVSTDMVLYAITSRTVTLTINANGGTTTIGTIRGEAYNTNPGAEIRIPVYDKKNMCRTGTNYTKFAKGNFSADGYLIGYKYIGLTDNASSNTVKYCQGNYLYLKDNMNLYAVWNEDYATTNVTSGAQLNLRTGCGTNYSLTGSSMNGSTTIYIQKEGSAYSSGYMGYWVKYGSRTGCASSKYLKNFKYPSYNSCDRTDYVCNGGTAADITMTPSTLTLNLKKSDQLSGTITIDSRCGSYTVASNNTSVATVSNIGGDTWKVTAVPGSVAENQKKTVTITTTGKWDCTATTSVVVKNSNDAPPTVDISINGKTYGSGYKTNAIVTATCTSPEGIASLVATDSKGKSFTYGGDSNTKTATLKLTGSSSGRKITAVCTTVNEISASTSKTYKIYDYSASSACGVSSYSYSGSCSCVYAGATMSTPGCNKIVYDKGGCAGYCKNLTSYYSGSGNCSRTANYKTCWHY